MAKIYQFPQKKQGKSMPNNVPNESQVIMQNAINVLIETYTERIGQLEKYIEAIRNLDGTGIKNPKELLNVVKELDKVFVGYGISNNFYTFTTISNKKVNYYNDNKMIGVYEEGKREKIAYYTTGEFIHEFEYHQFNLVIHEEIYSLLEGQIKELKITIEVLKKTKI